MYDYSKLKGKIVEVYGTQAKFAEAMEMTGASLSKKLSNITNFQQDEIEKSITLLSIENPTPYFFTKEVNKM